MQANSRLSQLRQQPLQVYNGRLAGKTAAHVGCSLPIYQAAILQQRQGGPFRIWRTQGHNLEWSIAVLNDCQQSLGIVGLQLADDGNLSWLRKGKRSACNHCPNPSGYWLIMGCI